MPITQNRKPTYYFGLYNWSLYLCQLAFLIVLSLFTILLGVLTSAPRITIAGYMLSALPVLNLLLLLRESRQVLANDTKLVLDGIEAIADLTRCLTLLDAGCGLGRTTISVAKRWPHLQVTAIDTWHPEHILGNSKSQLRSNLRIAHLLRRVRIHEADVRILPFDAATFDCATAIWVLHELPPLDQVVSLSELARVLHEDGVIVVVESMRCLRNLLVFGLINWHFQTYRHWVDLGLSAGLTLEASRTHHGQGFFVFRQRRVPLCGPQSGTMSGSSVSVEERQ